MLLFLCSDLNISIGQFLLSIKYLGTIIGPDSLDASWNQVLCDYLATSRFIASLSCGLLTKVSLYNMLAIAKLSYIASFLPLNVAAFRAENRALQTLCRGPWNAIPPNLLKSVKQIGMPAQATDLNILAIASKVRIAHVTSQNIFAKSNEIDNVYNGFDIVLRYLDYKLCNSTCIKSICQAYSDFASSNDIRALGDFSQQKVYKKLWGQRTPFCFKGFVSLKAKRILGEAPNDSQINKVIAGYVFASSKSFALTFTHIRAISNHWCTRSRFGSKFKGCVFSCGNETDNIKHTCVCGNFWSSFFKVADITPFPISLERIVVFSHNSILINDNEIYTILIGLHICFLCFNACRHGKSLSDRLIQHHLSHFMRLHHKASAVLRALRG